VVKVLRERKVDRTEKRENSLKKKRLVREHKAKHQPLNYTSYICERLRE